MLHRWIMESLPRQPFHHTPPLSSFLPFPPRSSLALYRFLSLLHHRLYVRSSINFVSPLRLDHCRRKAYTILTCDLFNLFHLRITFTTATDIFGCRIRIFLTSILFFRECSRSQSFSRAKRKAIGTYKSIIFIA